MWEHSAASAALARHHQEGLLHISTLIGRAGSGSYISRAAIWSHMPLKNMCGQGQGIVHKGRALLSQDLLPSNCQEASAASQS